MHYLINIYIVKDYTSASLVYLSIFVGGDRISGLRVYSRREGAWKSSQSDQRINAQLSKDLPRERAVKRTGNIVQLCSETFIPLSTKKSAEI